MTKAQWPRWTVFQTLSKYVVFFHILHDMCQCEITLSWKEGSVYLDKANMQPFMDPKQDRATNTGTTTEKLPITRSAKVCDGQKKKVQPVTQNIRFLCYLQNMRETVAGKLSRKLI